MISPRWQRWALAVALAVSAVPVSAAPRKITLQGTIEDAEKSGKRLDNITVQVMVGAVEKGKGVSKTVTNGGKMMEGYYEFDAVIDDTNPVINVSFQDRNNRLYLDDTVSLLVGESPLNIPKAMLLKTSRRATPDNIRTHAEGVHLRIFAARAEKMSDIAILKEFGPEVRDIVRLAVDRQPFSFDEGLQAEVGRLVRTWDAKPSAALSSRENRLLTYRAGATVVSVAYDGPMIRIPVAEVGFPSGKWESTWPGHVVGSAGGRLIQFECNLKPRKPVVVTPSEAVMGPQSLVTASPDGRRLASAGPGGTVTVFSQVEPSAAPRRDYTLVAGPGSVRALTFSQDGKFLAAATIQGEIVVWAVDTRTETRRFTLKKLGSEFASEVPAALAFAPDKPILAVGTGLSQDGKVLLVDIEKGAIVNALTGRNIAGEEGEVTNVRFGLKGEVLLVEFDHKRGAILDGRTGKLRMTLGGTLVPSADGEWLGVLTEENWTKPESRPEFKAIQAFLEKR